MTYKDDDEKSKSLKIARLGFFFFFKCATDRNRVIVRKSQFRDNVSLVLDVLYLSYLSLIQVKKLCRHFKKTRLFVVL